MARREITNLENNKDSSLKSGNAGTVTATNNVTSKDSSLSVKSEVEKPFITKIQEEKTEEK